MFHLDHCPLVRLLPPFIHNNLRCLRPTNDVSSNIPYLCSADTPWELLTHDVKNGVSWGYRKYVGAEEYKVQHNQEAMPWIVSSTIIGPLIWLSNVMKHHNLSLDQTSSLLINRPPNCDFMEPASAASLSSLFLYLLSIMIKLGQASFVRIAF